MLCPPAKVLSPIVHRYTIIPREHYDVQCIGYVTISRKRTTDRPTDQTTTKEDRHTMRTTQFIDSYGEITRIYIH